MRGGLPNLIAGSVLAATGGALITIMSDFASEYGETYSWAGIDFRLLLGVAIAAGLALFGLGVFQRFGPAPTGVKAARNDAQVIFRAMIAMIGVDSEFQDDEVVMVQRCCKHFFKRDMHDIEIWKALQAHGSSSFAGFAFGGAEQTASPEARRCAYTAAMLVAMIDGPPSEAEQAKLAKLGAVLRLSEDDRARAGQEAAQVYPQVKAIDPPESAGKSTPAAEPGGAL